MHHTIRSAPGILCVSVLLAACSSANEPTAPVTPTATLPGDLATTTASAEGLNGTPLVGLANWVRDSPEAIYSVLISRDDKLVFELYTGGIERPEAHYMMSVTKSVTSSLVGAALQSGELKSLDVPIAQLLPRKLFRSAADSVRFASIVLQEVMGMSALNVNDYPRDTSAAAYAHFTSFFGAANRAQFALTEPLLASPGQDFLYNDEGPMLVAGALQYATGKTLLEFGRARLFDALGFVNEEWMHQDPTGIDMGGYGFRMRPMDMQKFGLLYLHGGAWKGQQLLPADWVEKSWTPYLKSFTNATHLDYGWFWWTYDYVGTQGAGWRFLVADGLWGQRILVNREHALVVTMTGDIETGNESAVLSTMMNQYVIPAVVKGAGGASQSEIDGAVAQVHAGRSRVRTGAEPRMVPSVGPKETPVAFKP